MVPSPPAWIAALVATVAECLHAHSPMGPLGFRYGEEDGVWDLIVYPTPVELVGGAQDGTVVLPGFSLGLYAFLSAFERLTALHWCAHGFGLSETRTVPASPLRGATRGMRSGSTCSPSLPRMRNPVSTSTRCSRCARWTMPEHARPWIMAETSAERDMKGRERQGALASPWLPYPTITLRALPPGTRPLPDSPLPLRGVCPWKARAGKAIRIPHDRLLQAQRPHRAMSWCSHPLHARATTDTAHRDALMRPSNEPGIPRQIFANFLDSASRKNENKRHYSITAASYYAMMM